MSRADLVLLHEALVYTRKRSFQPVEAVRLQGLQERVEGLLLDRSANEGRLRLSPPEQEVLARELPRYCEAMTQRGGSTEGLRQAERLRQLLQLLAPQTNAGPWWKKLFRR